MYERIRVLCKEFGYTIQTLEKLASISNGTIGKWQKSYPRADYLQRVAKVLNTTSDYLVTGKGPAHPEEAKVEMNEYLQKLRDDPNTRTLFDLAETATTEEIKATVTFFKMLRNQGRDSE